MTVPDHPLTGHGAVVLDIGGDVGAVVVLLPDDGHLTLHVTRARELLAPLAAALSQG